MLIVNKALAIKKRANLNQDNSFKVDMVTALF